jgi:hypothetical protein
LDIRVALSCHPEPCLGVCKDLKEFKPKSKSAADEVLGQHFEKNEGKLDVEFGNPNKSTSSSTTNCNGTLREEPANKDGCTLRVLRCNEVSRQPDGPDQQRPICDGRVMSVSPRIAT